MRLTRTPPSGDAPADRSPSASEAISRSSRSPMCSPVDAGASREPSSARASSSRPTPSSSTVRCQPVPSATSDTDPNDRQVTEAVFTEFFEPDVFVAKQRISGAPGVDPEVPLELRVEFMKMGKTNTLVRVVQGPYDPAAATDYSDGWESELAKLSAYLDEKAGLR